ncbi:MAG: hypothetical protein ACJ8FY_19045 [Gemmataceae bacterium]
MSTQATMVESGKKAQSPRTLPRPPAEQFWRRYSPHHEIPLSGLSSVAMHALVGGLIVIGAIWWSRAKAEEDKPLPFGTLEVAADGDTPKGQTKEPGNQGDAQTAELPPSSSTKRPPAIPPLPNEPMPSLELGIKDSPDYGAIIEDNKLLGEKIRNMPPFEKTLLDNLNGKGSPNRDRGPVERQGPNKNPPPGDPKGPPAIKNIHVERQLRWTMNFNTTDGSDYAKQLRDLGAKIAVPLQGDKAKFLLIKDLAKPKKTETVDDLSELKLIWWTDDTERSIKELAKALGIKPAPSRIIAFFPRDLEERLAEMELAFAKKHEHQTVTEIGETTFQVKRSNDKYEPVVIDQRYKK